MILHSQDTDYLACTPASRLELAGELHIMRECYLRKDAALADGNWKASLVPVWSLLVHVATNTRYFVIGVLKTALWVWPAISNGPASWTLDPDITKLQLIAVFSLEPYKVQPVTFSSPVHMRLKDPPVPYPRVLNILTHLKTRTPHPPIPRMVSVHVLTL